MKRIEKEKKKNYHHSSFQCEFQVFRDWLNKTKLRWEYSFYFLLFFIIFYYFFLFFFIFFYYIFNIFFLLFFYYFFLKFKKKKENPNPHLQTTPIFFYFSFLFFYLKLIFFFFLPIKLATFLPTSFVASSNSVLFAWNI